MSEPRANESRISVVVIGRNEAGNLPRCFSSIAAARDSMETPPIFFETIFVDAGSTDNSIEVAAQYADAVYRLDGPNTWAPTARTAGLMESRGEYVLFLDGDMKLHPEWFNTACAELAISPTRAGVSGIRDDIYVDDATGRILGTRANVYGASTRKRARNVGGALMIRRAVADELEGYRTELRKWADPDFHARLLSSGSQITELPVPFIEHFTPLPAGGAAKARSLVRRDGGGHYFGLMLHRSLQERYLGGVLKVFPTTFLLWLADVLTLILVLRRKFAAMVALQAGCVLWVLSRRKKADLILSRILMTGAAKYLAGNVLKSLSGAREQSDKNRAEPAYTLVFSRPDKA